MLFGNFSSNRSKNTVTNNAAEDRADFITALASFSLVHTELISFQAMLRVQEIHRRAAELTSTSEEMAAMTEDVSASVQQINASMQEIDGEAGEAMDKIRSLDEVGGKVKTVLESLMGNVAELSEQIKNIDAISQNVSDIADQTNLLALNAAIEAARAGEAGRGFNVVAEEVRKLAGQTKEAVSNVKQISEQMNIKSTTTNGDLVNVQSTFKQYLDNAETVRDFIKLNTEHIDECTQMVENITGAAEQQTAVSEKLSSVSQALTENCEFISGVLGNEADNLCKIVNPLMEISNSGSVVNILAARLMEHAGFLRKTMDEAGRGGEVVSYTQCAFAKWYQENKGKYGDIEAFVEIDEPHRRVHEAAERVSKKCSSESVKDLMNASADMLKGFIKLYQAFKTS
ncbi:methyl-accepting chemotaxis protein [Desulfohalotomaculum tongense]|uniref:methyl-accepting chemotaxis protein n=1 Tax=Desulforadius tongensis TaxID=1216062 RepID=UPI00195E41E6|nr:methyl-accepting chemotaxis protein [Desulforadius tongensis]MBM7856143.1 methyl-accepting chemotaxis protein [Desulforadius tongensis]